MSYQEALSLTQLEDDGKRISPFHPVDKEADLLYYNSRKTLGEALRKAPFPHVQKMDPSQGK